ncbi:MAG TPA: HlyD family secretion protein [Gemmatimonadaceae bacterium]|nr:HlyD family secretion protein [Gemmatimonadaceae bacterium]
MLEHLRRPRVFIPAIAIVAVVALVLVFGGADAADSTESISAKVKSGEFRVVVTTTGELRARKAVQIQGPPNMQAAQVYQTRISTLVPEGTVVKEGDLVAELDRSAVAAKFQEVSLALQKAEAQYTQAELDSALNLATAREEIRTLELALEEKRIARDQSKYEAPSIRRQADIEHEKAERAFAQAKVNYVTKKQQAIAKMREVGSELGRQRNQLGIIQSVMNGFTIKAPAPGMVIYDKEWNGRKKVVGSQVSAWDPTVATLPDLTQMESVTYVNEIDVRKIAVGQPAEIALDADPSKRLTGKVEAVANVGEQRPNADAKVFEVKITIVTVDTTLRPGMTTANQILTASIPNKLSVPLEAVNSEDSVTFVFKRDGGSVVKQEVETGAMNENEIVIARGLEADDEVLLTPPENRADLSLERLPASKPSEAPVARAP